jgi:2'-5' RNA ligase
MMKRVFIAINLPQEIKDELGREIIKLKKENSRAHIKWVEPENLHLTLHFLGSLDDEKIKQVIEEAQKIVSKYSAFEMSLGIIGCFPDPKRPRVIFVEAIESRGVVRQIHAELKSMLQKLGIETDTRPWQSHITLGRVKIPSACRGLDINISPSSFSIESVDLMESELLPQGPRYSIIKSFKLVS